ncbi:MAG: hypothetical protein R6V04_04420 [bacterium]
MKKRKYLAVILILINSLVAIFFINCEKSKSLLTSNEYTMYNYVAYDSTEIKVAQGMLLLNFEDDIINGEWDIKAVGSAQNIGPQIGSGNLVGSYSSDSIWVELQPQMCDNNLQLKGRLKDNSLAGQWIYISFIGPTNSGTFTARKISL